MLAQHEGRDAFHPWGGDGRNRVGGLRKRACQQRDQGIGRSRVERLGS
jgi:hypothetical protein